MRTRITPNTDAFHAVSNVEDFSILTTDNSDFKVNLIGSFLIDKD